MLVLFVAGCVSSFTLEETLWGVSTLSTTGRSAAIHMVFTGLNGVGPATYGHNISVRIKIAHVYLHRSITDTQTTSLTNVRVVETSSDQSLFHPEVPGCWGVATITSKKITKTSQSQVLPPLLRPNEHSSVSLYSADSLLVQLMQMLILSINSVHLF